MDMKVVLAAAVLSGLSGVSLAGDHIVPSSGETATATAEYGTLTVHGNYGINSGVTVTATSGIALAPDAGDVATVTVDGTLKVTGNNNSLGAGNGCFVINKKGATAGTAGLWLNKFTVSSSAVSTGDYIDLLTLNEGAGAVLGLVDVSASTAKPTRILFNGGKYILDYSTSDRWFKVAQDHRIILESVNGNPISFFLNYTESQTFFSGGFAETRGSGDVIFDANYYSSGVSLYGDGTWNGFRWNHTGDLVLTNKFGMKINSRHNVLPYGEGRGIVRLYDTAQINLTGKTNTVNGLVTKGSSKITNSSATKAVLQLGSWGENGMLSAAIGAKVAVRKMGVGTLSVNGTVSESELNAEGGIVTLANSSFAGASTVGEGAIVRFGVNQDTVKWGGSEGFISLSGPGTLEKVGNSYCHWDVTKELPENVSVSDGGMLRIVRPACANKWYRFVFKKTRGDQSLTVHTIGLVDANGSDVTTAKGYTGSIGDDVVNMTPGTYIFPTGTGYETGTCSYNSNLKGGLSNLTTDNGYNEMIWTATPDPDQPETWQQVTFRLKDDTAPIVGYTLYRDWMDAHVIEDWTVETSADGVTWELIDERTGYRADFADKNNGLGWWNNRSPICWNRGSVLTAASFAGKSVSLSGGAKLDLAAIPQANVSIDSLEIDCATGGSVSTFVPAANGALYLKNVPTGVDLKRVAIPVTFGTVADGANLAGWKVYVDGTLAEHYTVKVNSDSTGLKLGTDYGLMLILR